MENEAQTCGFWLVSWCVSPSPQPCPGRNSRSVPEDQCSAAQRFVGSAGGSCPLRKRETAYSLQVSLRRACGPVPGSLTTFRGGLERFFEHDAKVRSNLTCARSARRRTQCRFIKEHSWRFTEPFDMCHPPDGAWQSGRGTQTDSLERDGG